METLIQCDFDGTITENDVSYFLLDSFARRDWRRLLQEYEKHRIHVGEFNTRAFGMVKADKQTLLEAIKGEIKIRAGFQELVSYCFMKGYRFVIVSNGLDFYIEAILKELGLENVETHAAQTSFCLEGMEVRYVGPDGKQLTDGFKEAYVKLFQKQGYRVVYIGNGDSDSLPAKYAYRVFATSDLLTYCRKNKLACESFTKLTDVVEALETS